MNHIIPISPLDCFFDPEKDINKKYLVFNKFDFSYYKERGYDVSYEQISLEYIFKMWEKSIEEKEHRVASVELKSHKYKIDLRELYFFNSIQQGYKNIFENAVENKIGHNFDFKPLFFKKKTTHFSISFKTILNKTIKILIEIKEFLIYNSLLIEDHNSLFRKRNSHKRFKNRIFNIVFSNKIKKLTNEIWLANSEYFNTNSQFYKSQLQTLVSSLLYLQFKKFEEIHLANFTAPYQQAAIIYAEANSIDYMVVQHGRWMVHHLPSPLHKEFCTPETFIIWEREFLAQINAELTHLKERPKSRLTINHPGVVDDYVLIATSTPMIIDLDIYHKFWSVISVIKSETSIEFKIKFHLKDQITPKIMEFFNIKDIDYINNIETLPKKAIVVNSTIYYELKDYTNVIDYKLSTTKEQILEFLNF